MTSRLEYQMKQRRQRGVALIVVLLIIALGVTLISVGAVRSQVAIKRVENNRTYHQLYQLALMGEHWATLKISRDTNGYDSYKDPWAKLESPQVFDGATVQIRIEDEQSKINLNNLATGLFWRRIFIRFLNSLDVDKPEKVYEQISDYIDANQMRLSYGESEIAEYTKAKLPYRPLDRQLTIVDEVLAAAGLDKKAIEIIRPYVTVYPLSFNIGVNPNPSPTNAGQGRLIVRGEKINILTCDLQIFNLFTRTNFSDVGLGSIQRVREDYNSSSNVVHQNVLRLVQQYGTDLQSDTLKLITGSESKVFSVTTTVELGGRSLTMYSLLYRPNATTGSRIQVIERRSELN